MQQTTDGGYILGGQSKSDSSGNKTQPLWGTFGTDFDYWIVKTDSLGNKQWDKDFGGMDFDYLMTVKQTADGGYILGGYSVSGISGDKTQPLWSNTWDYWIVKTDSLGIKQWDRDFGGIGSEYFYSIEQTTDGGYILAGYTDTGINGDKTEASRGAIDYWIIKTDSLGNKQWDKCFGGTGWDQLRTIQQTADGGYILGGSTSSGISGDKTQANWGATDYWIVKTDSLGIKQWDKDFGGTLDDVLFSIVQTIDGGYILGGYSLSGLSGDKTQPLWGGTLADFWIIKTDSLGNKQWDKDFGGTGTEELYSISQTTDGGYLMAGDSYSPISGDKTESNLGLEQTWILKTDSLGNKQWDKTVITSGHDENSLAIQTIDGCYAIANSSDAGISGYKTEIGWGGYEYWIVKLCELPIINFTAIPALCPGTCTSFQNFSINATIYEWSFPGAIPDTSTDVNPQNICYNTQGSYDVQLIATNVNGSDTLLLANYITVYSPPAVQAITQSGDTLSANQGAATYQWYFNGNIVTGATDYFYVTQANGDYNVVCTDSNGCEVEAAIFDVVAGIDQIGSEYDFTITPNPAQNLFTIHPSSQLQNVQVEVYNVLGKKADSKQNTLNKNEITIDVSELSAGIYFVKVKSEKGIVVRKLVVE